MRAIISAVFASLGLLQPVVAQQIITTVAGGGPNNLPATSAFVRSPNSLVMDGKGGYFFCSEEFHRVFRVDARGQLTVLAGNGTRGFSGDGGRATLAQLYRPSGVTVDAAGNVFVADTGNSRVRRVDASTGVITTVVGNATEGFDGDGGPATGANLRLDSGSGLAMDATGNLFIADKTNGRIRRVDALTGIIATVAGNGMEGFSGDGGTATSASLDAPSAVAVDTAGNLFIADTGNSRIRRVGASTGIITTVAGNGANGFGGDGGLATGAILNGPTGVAVDRSGNVFIADRGNNRIRRLEASTGVIITVAGDGTSGFSGDGGPATEASLRFDQPALDPNGLPGVGFVGFHAGVTVDGAGNIFIADVWNDRVRRVDASTGIITTVAGGGFSNGDGGLATDASLFGPSAVAVDPAGNLFIGNRRVDARTGIITTVAGGGSVAAVDAAGNLFIVDSSNSLILQVDAATGAIATVAGNGTSGFSGDGGPGTSASLHVPSGVAVDAAGNVFIVEGLDGRIRRVDVSSGIITTFASGLNLSFYSGIAVDAVGNLFIADTWNYRVLRVNGVGGGGSIVAGGGTLSGDGEPATSTFLIPFGVAVDVSGNILISDNIGILGGFAGRVRRVDASTGIITTLAGNGTYGFGGDGGPATNASLAFPLGLAVDATGDVFIADHDNFRVRRVGSPTCDDVDGDGYAERTDQPCPGLALGDCDDTNPRIHPGAAEICDGVDNNCDGSIDEGFGVGMVCTADVDACHQVTGTKVCRSDGTGADCSGTIVFHDATPPQISLSITPAVLWPPNHRMVDVTASADVSDACSASAVVLTSVTSNEPDDEPGVGDGNTINDIQTADLGMADFEFQLRAERDGAGGGRVYTIIYTATDAFGNVATASASVSVPHDQRGESDPVMLSVAQNDQGTSLAWTVVPGAISYSVVRGNVSNIRETDATFDLGAVTCLEAGSLDTSTVGHEDCDAPAPGEAFFYLVAYNDGWGSTYGTESSSKPRVAALGECQ